MKTRLIACLSLAAVLTAGLSVVLINSSKDIKKVEGYSTSDLPTTIDLNDSSESTIRSYYSSLNNKSTSERQGNNLLKNLKTILKNGQKYYSYDSGNAIWQMYEITDRDWDKSPASAITNYNSTSNKINGYTYGESTSSKGSNPYIHALYINRNVTNQVRAWDDHQQTQWGINREHVWAKAEGFDSGGGGGGGARGDAMHLIAGNGYANNIHSNYFYGYVNTSSSYTNCGSKYSNLSGNLLGKSKTLGGSTNVFEPQDCDKGDIARAIFYMVARYNYLSGSDSDGIDGANPNLSLSQSLSDWKNSGYTSSTSTKGYMGIMTDLLAWHHADPVDEYEIHRNNLLYTNFTKNRNPFIDFPEWADFIWGSVNYNGSTYVSHSTTPTGYATPSSDTINGYNSGGSTVSVTGVTLDKASATVAVDGTVELTPTVTPSNATNKAVTWSSSNSSVATVTEGVVTGKAAGTATITVTTKDGSKTATCTVTVKSLSSITVSSQTTAFNTGDDFVFGGTVTAHFSDSSTADVTSIAIFGGYDLSVAGNQTVTVSYGNKQTTYGITVTASGEITWTKVTDASSLVAGDKVVIVADGYEYALSTTQNSNNRGRTSVTKDENTVSWEGDSVQELTLATGTVSNTFAFDTGSGYLYAASSSSNYLRTQNSIDGNASFTVSITDGVATLTANGTNTNKILKYNNGSSIFSCYGSGQQDVCLYKKEQGSATPTLSSIAVKTAPTKVSYSAGEDFDATGLVITLTYSDASTEDVAYKDNEDSFEFDPIDNLQTSNVSVTISYGGKTCSQPITVSAAVVTSISAEVKNSKTFYVGETITKSDITVTTNTGVDVTNSATFSDYTFTYADAASGGTITDKTFTNGVTYGTFSCNLTARVQRKARVEAGTVTDTLTRELIGVTSGSYASWTGKSNQSDAVYAGNSAGGSAQSGDCIQIRSNNDNSGIVSTYSGGKLKSVSVTFNSYSFDDRAINIYGKNSAYDSASDLYSSLSATQGTLLGTIVKGASTSLTISGDYTYIGIRSDNGAIYIDEINITYGSDDYAENLANYIMYEDTNNQCDTKTDIAIGYFEGLSAEERTTFMTSNGYVIFTARERLNAWLRNQGKIISNSNNDYVVQVNKAVLSTIINSNNMTTVIAVILSSFGVMSIGGYFLFRKNKED